jgi:hypothetical protein
VVLSTAGAPRRRRLERRRRARRLKDHAPAPVPTARAGVVRTKALGTEEEAGAWLEGLRRDRVLLDREVTAAVGVLNRLVQAHRAAAADPYARDLLAERALVVRVGHGTGEQVADGRFAAACEAPPTAPRARRMERLSPQERLAAILGGRDRLLASDELVLRARSDLDAGRWREAALQSRIALECILAELGGGDLGELRGRLEGHREAVSAAAAAALTGEPPDDLLAEVEEAVGRREAAIRRHRSASP